MMKYSLSFRELRVAGGNLAQYILSIKRSIDTDSLHFYESSIPRVNPMFHSWLLLVDPGFHQ